MNRYHHVRSLDDLSYISHQSKHILTRFSGAVTRVMHEVSPILCSKGSQGYRDVLVIAYERVK